MYAHITCEQTIRIFPVVKEVWISIKLRMDMGNMSKRQQSDQTAKCYQCGNP